VKKMCVTAALGLPGGTLFRERYVSGSSTRQSSTIQREQKGTHHGSEEICDEQPPAFLSFSDLNCVNLSINHPVSHWYGINTNHQV